MATITTNGSKWAGEAPDIIDELKRVLQLYPLDPIFEKHGNFVQRHPQWLNQKVGQKYRVAL